MFNSQMDAVRPVRRSERTDGVKNLKKCSSGSIELTFDMLHLTDGFPPTVLLFVLLLRSSIISVHRMWSRSAMAAPWGTTLCCPRTSAPSSWWGGSSLRRPHKTRLTYVEETAFASTHRPGTLTSSHSNKTAFTQGLSSVLLLYCRTSLLMTLM